MSLASPSGGREAPANLLHMYSIASILIILLITNQATCSYVQLGNSSSHHHLVLNTKTLLPLTSNTKQALIHQQQQHHRFNQQHQQLPTTLINQTFNYTTKEKICIGTSYQLAAQEDKTEHLHNLAERYKGCTYVMGNLEITWVEGGDKVDLSFLESIREITGYLLIAHVDLERIRMPNLQVIRGRELFRLPKGETDFALFIKDNNKLHQLELPNFREILAGSVGFYYNKNLCNSRINWDEIINSTFRTDFRYDGAQPECKACDPSCKEDRCWGEGPELCQKLSKINCADQCNGGRCFGPEPRECCHSFCAAGCLGPGQSDCLACKTFDNDGECIQECPPLQIYNPTKFVWEHNKLGKYTYGNKCVQECPGHLLRDNGACVITCPSNKKPNTLGECVPCTGPCRKECQGVDVIHSGNIDQLVNCTVIEGSLTILESSFTGNSPDHHPLSSSSSSNNLNSNSNSNSNGTYREYLAQPMHPDRLEVLKNIREITGYLSIQANHKDFKNLSYFKNLQIIGGRQTTDMFYSLSIVKSSLVSLNLRSLKKIRSGKILIEENKELCFADTINWSRLNVTKSDDITIRNNADINRCKASNLTCHKQCSEESGCWGPNSDECLSCKNYKFEDYCVENCNQIKVANTNTIGNYSNNSISTNRNNNNRYQNNNHNTNHQKDKSYINNQLNSIILTYEAGNKTCKRCHPECRDGCNGTEAIHCSSCKNVREGLDCIQECPSHKYNKNGSCEECDTSCSGGCTGPSNKLAEGGCNSCGKTVFTIVPNQQSSNTNNNNNISSDLTLQAHCIRANESCPIGYYQEYHFAGSIHSALIETHGLKLTPGKPVCRKCHHRCKSCTGLGTHVSVCECAKYMAGEQCEDFCPRDYFPNEQLGQCIKCSPECNGCFGPTEADCISCRVYRIYEPIITISSQTITTEHQAALSVDVQQFNIATPPFGDQSQRLKFNCTAQCPPDKPHRISESNMLDPYCSENPGVDLDGNPRIVSLTSSASILFIIIIASLAIVCFSIYRCQIEKDKTVKLMTIRLSGIDDVEPLTPSNLKPNLSPLISIKETELRKGKILGSGFGGTVYQGLWFQESDSEHATGVTNRKPRPVAIKVLRDNGQSNMNKEFLDEAYIMASVNHPNLVRLLAVCMTPNNLMLVTQLMPLGCLLDHVKKYRNDIGPKDLLEWGKQIAKGMAYLEEHRMVHRDLALRNVLLQTWRRALISDFGLAKFLEIDQSEYSHTGGGRLPIRWLAPECIRERKFTHKSDVWAFGVTVWELLNFGKIPFEEYDTKQVPMEIERGARLQQPAYMSAEVYKVIYSCWFYQPEKRPTFSQLAQDFSKFARDPGRYLICGSKSVDCKPYDVEKIIDSCEEYNSADELQSGTEDVESPLSANIPPDLTPSTHNRINENRFAFEVSRQLTDEHEHGGAQLAKRLSRSQMFQPHDHEIGHHPHHHHHHPDVEEVFREQVRSNQDGKHVDINNNNIDFIATSFRWPIQHTVSSNSIGQRSEQPTDMYDYLMPSPIVDAEQGNFSKFYTGSFNTRSTQMLATSGAPTSSTGNRQPPHSAGLVGVNNEEYFLTYMNNSVQVQKKIKKRRRHSSKRRSESYDIDNDDDQHLVGNSFDMTDSPSTTSTASTLSATTNSNLLAGSRLSRSRKLSTSNGNMPQSLV